MAFARIDGKLVHWRESGPEAAPPVVLINSLGTDFRIWDDLVSGLSRNWRVIAYDKQGHGLSETPAGSCTISGFADDLLALADHLELTHFSIIGLSIGGLIGQALALRAPERLSALILADTAPKIGTSRSWEERIEAVQRGGLGMIADAVMERWFTPGFHDRQPEQVAGWRNAFLAQPAAGYIAACEALRGADLTSALGRIRTPTLAVAGDQDLATPPELVAAMARKIPGARFEIIEECGHIPPVEQPTQLLALVIAHLKEHGRG